MFSTTKPYQRLDYSQPATLLNTLKGTHDSSVWDLAVLPKGQLVSGSDKGIQVLAAVLN